MNAHWIVVTLVAVLFLPSCAPEQEGGSRATSAVSPQILDWPGVGKGFLEWGQTPEGFFGTSKSDGQDVLEAWTWHGTAPTKKAVNIPSSLSVTVLPADRYLACVAPPSRYSSWPLKLMSFASQEAVRTWDSPARWDYSHVGASANGLFVALIMTEDMANPAPDIDWNNLRHKVGLLDTSTWNLRWVANLKSKQEHSTIRQISVSNDGRYVAIGGWNNGVALIDASQEKVLWAERPPTEVSTGYAVFSSDGQTLYTAGSEGCVYAIETTTGRILSQRWANQAGKSVYGHRTSCLALSPDDQWLAAGTGPEGHVYLWSITSPDLKPRLLSHGGTTILIVSFSLDSKRLASIAGGKIKIWSIVSGLIGASDARTDGS